MKKYCMSEYYFYSFVGTRCKLKELGEYLKENRINNGVGIEEAAKDLNLPEDCLINIEEGNIRTFKDVLQLRSIIKDYAKYLGLNAEKIVDDFNDFMFEHTSRISLDDILAAEKKQEINIKKISSPYTKIPKKGMLFFRKNIVKYLIIFTIIIVLLIIIIKILQSEPETIIRELRNVRSDECEFAYKINCF